MGIVEAIGAAFTWIVEQFQQLFLWAYDGILSGVAGLLEAIPTPGGPSIGTLFASIPNSVWWFAEVAQFEIGLALFGVALLTRFLIRRIPIIG